MSGMLLVHQNRDRWTILTSKLDLPQPGGARSTRLRSCQKLVSVAHWFQICAAVSEDLAFFGGGEVRLGCGLVSGEMNFELWIWPQVRRWKVTFLDWPGMISSKQNPPHLIGVTTLNPELLTPANNRLCAWPMKSLAIWSFIYIMTEQTNANKWM